MSEKTKGAPTLSLPGEVRNSRKIDGLQNRVERYQHLKTLALENAEYLKGQPDVKAFQGLVSRVRDCGNYLQFRNYYTVDQVLLHRASFCDQHLLCQFCALLRGAKYTRKYMEKVELVINEKPWLKPYLVSLTIKNGPDLRERYAHIIRSMGKMMQLRRDAGKGRRETIEMSKADGGVYNIEVKRGEGSGEWHPHVHSTWLCEEAPDSFKLSREWEEITGDSIIVDSRPFDDDPVSAFLEVFAYALKFSTMEKDDLWTAFKLLRGKRMIRSFGSLFGVPEPETLTDEPLSDDLPYIDMLYRWAASGYTYTGPSQKRFLGVSEENIFPSTPSLSLRG